MNHEISWYNQCFATQALKNIKWKDRNSKLLKRVLTKTGRLYFPKVFIGAVTPSKGKTKNMRTPPTAMILYSIKTNKRNLGQVELILGTEKVTNINFFAFKFWRKVKIVCTHGYVFIFWVSGPFVQELSCPPNHRTLHNDQADYSKIWTPAPSCSARPFPNDTPALWQKQQLWSISLVPKGGLQMQHLYRLEGVRNTESQTLPQTSWSQNFNKIPGKSKAH